MLKFFDEFLLSCFRYRSSREFVDFLCAGGHYVAYCRNDLNQMWYEFDDQSVTEVSESCVQNAEAYVLFYK